jgi:hypothetical protein
MEFMIDWIRVIPIKETSQNASFLSLASTITRVHNYCHVLQGLDRQHILFLAFLG